MLERRSLFKLAAAAVVMPRTLIAQTPPPASSATPWRIQRLSWAGIRIEGSGATLFVDPWISPATEEGKPAPSVVMPEASAARRAVLLTHLHNDHFDPAAVKRALGDNGVVICLDRMAAIVASRGFRVWSVEEFHPQPWADFIVMPVPAQDGFGVEQVSWVIIRDDRRVIHCGDTAWHSRFDLIGNTYGPFDYAFLPPNGVIVAGDKPPLNDQPRTLTPHQAVTAARLLRARTLVPIHYGHADADYHEHANAIAELRQAAAEAGQDVRIAAEGDWL